MLATIRKTLLILLFLAVAGYLGYQGLLYRQARLLLPVGTTVAGLDVSGMTAEDAQAKVAAAYARPIYLSHRGQQVEIEPGSLGFTLGLDAMFDQLEDALAARDERLAFIGFVLARPLEPVTIPLQASHDRETVRLVVQSVSDFLDMPARPPQMLADEITARTGEAGFVTDVQASLPAVEEALYRVEGRSASLVVEDQEAPPLNLAALGDAIQGKLQGFDGLGSVWVMDLETGEEIGINADVAMSGLSILKIAIFVEAYRALDETPNPEQQQLFVDTAARSSNYGANLLLHVVAGEDNTYRGADVLTESMGRLGLVNTFMAVPYDATPPSTRQTTYVTPANSRTDVTSQPDPTMQSTAEEIGSLLSMIYYCSKGGGALLAVYPGEITPQECQAILDLMVLNEEGNLIRYGVPDGTPVSHKHGWALSTHADAGVVFTPGGDYVLVEYLYQPGDWLLAETSFPILREISRAAYNYFNADDPYVGDALVERRSSIDPDDPFSEAEADAAAAAGGDSGTPDEAAAEPTATPEATSN
jgi:beta-lactamase class A